MMKSTFATRMTILSALSAFLLLSGCGKGVNRMNQEALEAISAGNYAKAEEALREAIRIRPTNRTLRRNLVEVYFRQNKWDEAIRLLESTLEIAGLGSDQELKTSLAIANTMKGVSVIANNQFRELLEEDPENRQLLFLDGVTAIAPQRAIGSLSKAIEMDPGHRDSYFALIRAYTYAGEPEKARETLAEITRRFGESDEVALYEISLLFAENDMDGARAKLASLPAGKKDLPTARLFEAYLALGDGENEAAQVIFEGLEDEEEVSDRAKLGQALCLLSEGESNLAIELCEEVLADNPEEVVAYNLLGLGQLKRLQRFLAKKNFEISLEKNPDQPAIRALVDRIENL
jgi:tetratricopeptide (TPR) repeat protein